jgi:peptidyl-prolyl cis-trans isomerase C
MRLRLLLALLVVIAVACHRKPAIPPDVVVRIGERMITLADLKRYLDRNAGTELAQLTPEVASALLDQYVEEVVLSEYAATHGVEVPADKIATAVRNDAGATVVEKRDEMRRERLVSSMSADLPQPTDEEIRLYYDQHPDEFKSPEEVRVRQILVHDESLANDIAKKLKAGEAFEKLSSEHSVAANARKGGEIGYLSRGELPKMFEEQIFALKPGEISNVISTDGGFHIFKVDERRAAGTIDLQTAEPVIRERLKEESVRKRMAQLVAKSRGEMQIAVLTKRLPFRYSGTLPKSENE